MYTEEKQCAGPLAPNLDIPIWLWEPQTWCRVRAMHEAKQAYAKLSMADKKFIDEVVKAHNQYRANHQASSLKHAADLSSYAQKWADHLAANNTFQHSSCTHGGDRLGENIAMKWSSKPDAYTGQEVTDQWYSEIKMHQFGGEPRSTSTGHFTQVVWKGSKEVGIGKAQTRDGKVIVVASYRPAGNMMGRYGENVLPPKDGKISVPVQREAPSSDSSPFSSRFGDFGKDSSCSQKSQGGGESRSVKTHTTTEGSGANAVTKTIVEETITKPDGSKVTTRKETTSTGSSSGSDKFAEPAEFGRLRAGHGAGKPSTISSGNKSSSSDSSPDTSGRPQKMSEFIDECLKAHNDYRKKHGVPKLKIAKDLNGYAQKWAEHLAASNGFQHSQCTLNGDRIGENIACKWSSGNTEYTGQEASDQWYSEISKHDFGGEPRSLGSGHFTQMIWKGSKELGVGKAKTSGGKILVVASYRPAGNMVGSFRENVPPPQK